MTSQEVASLVMTLLDDSRASYIKIPDINAEINNAQLLAIKGAHASNDDRLLRLLYRESALIQNSIGNRVVADAGNAVLFPMSCRVYKTVTSDDNYSQVAEYARPEKFFGYLNQPTFEGGSEFPRSAYYTIVYKVNTSELYFTGPDTTRAKLVYIRYPSDFVWDPITPTNDAQLSVPQEYHFGIATMAAEILNDMDIGERERSQVSFQNQMSTIEGLGKVGN